MTRPEDHMLSRLRNLLIRSLVERGFLVKQLDLRDNAIILSSISPSKYFLTVPALFQTASTGSFPNACVKQTFSYETNHLQVMKEELLFWFFLF